MEKKSVILIKNSALKFTIKNIENTILDNALDSQINLPHGCKSGACGSCEAELVEGEIKTKSGVFVKKNNAILLCQAHAKSEEIIIGYQKNKLDLIIRNNLNENFFSAKDYFLQVVGNKSVTPLVKELSFFVPVKLNFKFQAGSHMEIYDKKNELSRKYSIINSPEHSGYLKKNILTFLITKNIKKGLSQHLHDLVKVGDILKLKGPFLSFQHEINQKFPILAIAGGTGLSPILSILKNNLLKNNKLNILLFLSVRDRDEILEMNTLYKLKEKYENFSFKITLTREKPFPNSQFLHGRVDVSLQKIFKDLSTHQVLISGSDGFVETSYNHALKLNAPKEKVYYEKFSSN